MSQAKAVRQTAAQTRFSMASVYTVGRYHYTSGFLRGGLKGLARPSRQRTGSSKSGTQLGSDLFRSFASFLHRADGEADRTNLGMTAAAVTLANRRQIELHRLARPGIGTDGDFRAKAGGADRNRVGGLREQIIRNELVVAF